MFQTAEDAAAHQQWTNAMQAYQDVLNEFPSGKHAGESFFKIGMIQYSQLRDFPSATKTFQAIVEKFPTSNQTPKALMTLGFLYANEPTVKNIDLARKYYQQLITQFPSNPLATDANVELEHLGEPADSILKDMPKLGSGSANKQEADKFSHDSLLQAPAARALAH